MLSPVLLCRKVGTSLQSLKVDEVFLQGALTDEDGRFNCEDIVRLLKYGEGLK